MFAALAVEYARDSPQRLFTLTYAPGTLVTVLLSNDATAVVLTPAVYAAAKAAGILAAGVVRIAWSCRPLPILALLAAIFARRSCSYDPAFARRGTPIRFPLTQARSSLRLCRSARY